ncbi:MAG: alpha/beta fold hydrolase [Litoreibacter sp.]|nr:alpha/beta fold hydrolase [Litoreibacter sp.]
MAAQSRFILCKPHHWHVQEMGEGPLLLLLHGAGGATQSWRHLMPALAEKFRCIAVDLPGQGFTKLGGLRRCGLDEMSLDLQKLCIREGWKPDAIIGHSAGAAIALRMAEDLTPTPRVVGINAALGNFKGLAGLLFPLMAKALAAMPGVAHMFTASTARPGSVARLIEGTGSNLSLSEQRFYRALVSDRTHVDGTLSMMAQWSLDGLLGRLNTHPAPTVLIAASNDKAVPPNTSREAAERMPDARFVALEGLGHLAHEEAPAKVQTQIESFLTT